MMLGIEPHWRYCLIVALLFTFVPLWNDAEAEDWKIFYKNNGVNVYYDSGSINHLSKNKIRVWVKWYPSLQEKQMIGSDTVFCKEFLEVHCREKMFRLLLQKHYDNKGRLIRSIENNKDAPDNLIEQSPITLSLHKILCG